jgi:hypothetical protein
VDRKLRFASQQNRTADPNRVKTRCYRAAILATASPQLTDIRSGKRQCDARAAERWTIDRVIRLIGIGAGQTGRAIERIVVAYEAGRDGFWLARWLRAL